MYEFVASGTHESDRLSSVEDSGIRGSSADLVSGLVVNSAILSFASSMPPTASIAAIAAYPVALTALAARGC
nr:MAG TPA: hypothetical protein [Caudoviricetes sp.]